jgi:hypothetical protein
MEFVTQVSATRDVASMDAVAIAVVEQDCVSTCVPDRGELHSARTVQGEVQAARLTVSQQNPLVKLEGSQQELLLTADRPLHEAA